MEAIDISAADYMQRISVQDFPSDWDQLGDENEVEETYGLEDYKTLDEAIKKIILFMGMQVWDRSDHVPEGKTAHTLYLSGIFRGTNQVLARVKLAIGSSSEGVTMKLSVRSDDSEVASFIASAVN